MRFRLSILSFPRLRVASLRAAGVMGTALALWTSSAPAETFTFHRERVLGTSLEVRVDADSSAAAERAEAVVLKEIERLSGILSVYDPASELSRWQRSGGGESVAISPELLEVLQASERWTRASGGAFQPATESLTRLWRSAAATGAAPSDAVLKETTVSLAQPHWQLNATEGRARKIGSVPLNFDALAKGLIVDRACLRAMDEAAVHGVLVCIGGDMRAAGSIVERVSVADPHNDAVNAEPIDAVYLHGGGLATSGNYRRGFQVGDRWYSHILDPKTGRPAEGIAGATVVAPTSAEADALATICNVLPPAESLKLIESLPETECLLVLADGSRQESSGWNDRGQPGLFRLGARATQFVAAEDAKGDAKEAKSEENSADGKLLSLVVNITLAKPSEPGYRRPYVAVWLEDADEFPVKTALLFLDNKQPGPRWHRDLIRWYRNDRTRKLADQTDLIGVISGATRGPGEYKAVFDGTDDAGKPLKPGKYTLYLEAAREHGTYQIIRQPLTLGADPIAVTKLKGNVEFESAAYEYRAAVPAAGAPAGESKPAAK